MKVRVLGCSGAIARQARTTAFLIGESLLVDAGTGVGDLTLDELARIDHVLLTHSHLDHLAALPLMLGSVAGSRHQPVRVHALPETLEALRRHIFNHEIWPDFERIPSPERPLLRLEPLAVGQQLALGPYRIEVLPARHAVPAVGYAVETPRGAWVFGGDSGPNPAFWQRVNRLPLAMLVIETAFSQREAALARLSGHLCPADLAAELAQLDPLPTGSPPLIGITHARPDQAALIRAEVEALGLEQRHRLVWLEAGQEFEF